MVSPRAFLNECMDDLAPESDDDGRETWTLPASAGDVVPGTQAATGAVVLRLVDRSTGRAPARVPPALVADLAASVTGAAPYPTLASA